VADEDRIRGYAEAFYAVARAEDELDAVEQQLYAFAQLVERDDRVRDALVDPALPSENKRGLIRDALGERANPIALDLLSLMVDLDRGRDIDRVVKAMAEVSAEGRSHALAEVRSAVPLDEERTRRLEQALTRATGRQVEVRVVVDPTVIGGIVARIGDEIFDGSVKTRLDDAKQQLVGS
jgi:F-type H+-transporting ATPase subunit delta